MKLRLDSRTVRSAAAGLIAILAVAGIEITTEEQSVLLDWVERTLAVGALVGAWFFRVNRRAE